MTNRKQFGILITLALGAGFVGGVIGSFFFTGEMVFAQKAPFKVKILQATEFQLLDNSGKISGLFKTEDDGSATLEFLNEKEDFNIRIRGAYSWPRMEFREPEGGGVYISANHWGSSITIYDGYKREIHLGFREVSPLSSVGRISFLDAQGTIRAGIHAEISDAHPSNSK